MKKIEISNVDQNVYYKKLDNGFEIYFLPFPSKNGYSVVLETKFGSIDTEFNNIKVPSGIAHFLEHKMFAQESGKDPFSYYSKTGTNCNASTGYKSTAYTINGNKNIETNIEYLLNYVYAPYFTDENVEKEKGIICEELLMYEDMPDRVLIDLMYSSVFALYKVRENVGGTVESVKKTTKEDLYNCYNVFYQPSNMFIMVSGNFDMDKVLKVIENNKLLNEAISNKPINRKEYDEPVKVYEKEKEVKLKVELSKLAYTIKIKHNLNNADEIFEFDLYLALFLSIMFGTSSKFREKVRNENLMTSFYASRSLYKDFFVLEFIAESHNPKKFISYLKKAISKIDVSEEEIERTKKVWISSEVMIADNYEASLENIAYDITEYGKMFPNKCEIYKNLNLYKFKEIMSKIDFNNSACVIVNKKDE
ncbi:MAG: pitrilysin family protein [Bacilli bacterium]